MAKTKTCTMMGCTRAARWSGGGGAAPEFFLCDESMIEALKDEPMLEACMIRPPSDPENCLCFEDGQWFVLHEGRPESVGNEDGMDDMRVAAYEKAHETIHPETVFDGSNAINLYVAAFTAGVRFAESKSGASR